MADTGDERGSKSDDDPIFRKLRSIYDDVAEEPLPDHLMLLLEKLDEVERKR